MSTSTRSWCAQPHSRTERLRPPGPHTEKQSGQICVTHTFCGTRRAVRYTKGTAAYTTRDGTTRDGTTRDGRRTRHGTAGERDRPARHATAGAHTTGWPANATG